MEPRNPILTQIIELIEKLEADAYERGQAAELQRVREFLRVREYVPNHELSLRPHGPPRDLFARLPPEGSGEAAVLADIAANTGTRGVDTVKRLDGQVHERTVRTALVRLRRKGLIERFENGWRAIKMP